MSLFEIGRRRLEQIAAEVAAESRSPNVLTFTRDAATRRQEAERFKRYHRAALANELANGAA